MALTLEQQRSTIFNCLNGSGMRDCSSCGAHSSRNGVCCFGRKYEPGDDDCSRCRHKEDCERFSHSYQPPPRPVWPGQQPIVHQRQYPSVGVRHVTPTNAPGQTQLQQNPHQPIVQVQPRIAEAHPYLTPAGPKPDESYAKYLTRAGVHGAVEGALTFILQLLQMRRPF